MNVQEVIRLCRVAAALSPSQRFDDLTPDVWAVPLADVTLADALEAVKEISKRQPYIAPNDIISEVDRVRAKRLAMRRPAPNVDPDDPQAQRAEMLAIRDAIASGRMDEAERDRYEAGGWNYIGTPPHYALGSAMVTRPAIAAAFGSMFRDARGVNRIPRGRLIRTLSEVEAEGVPDDREARLAAARARADAEAQA